MRYFKYKLFVIKMKRLLAEKKNPFLGDVFLFKNLQN